MERLEFELVSVKGLQKFYKSSKTLTKGYNHLFGRVEVWDKKEVTERVKPEYTHLFKEDGFNIICISNAHTHSEKLAFAGLEFENGTFERTQMQIEGVHTMSIHGGDIDSCWNDEVYLRLIARHNGYSQNNVFINTLDK